MTIIGTVLLVVFVIICVLLVSIVLIQSEEGAGMGGLFGGAGTQAFGSRSGNVITRTTYILVTLFFIASFGLAFINKAPIVRQPAPEAVQTDSSTETWLDAPAELSPQAVQEEPSEVQ
jgi:preprotein translocase subunit SecG